MSAFSIKKPISVWNRDLNADFPSLFRSIAKAAVSSATLDWPRAGKEASDAISAVGLKKEPGEMAWLLIYRALTQAFFTLAGEQALRFRKITDGDVPTSHALEALEEHEVTIHAQLFDRPSELPLLETLQAPFAEWLIGAGLEEARARSVAARIPRYFVFALAEEWQAREKDYQVVDDALNTPFSPAVAKLFDWQRYKAWLMRQVDEPVFDEGFSLRQIYIPLRAFRSERDKKQRHKPTHERTETRHVFELEDELFDWVSRSDPKDAIRVLSGGPGSGKSSFAKMFASRIASMEDRNVILLPLQYFEATDDLQEALDHFADGDPYLPSAPIDPKSDTKMLLILDGLDELALQGKLARDSAQRFVRLARRTAEQLNRDNRLRIQVLISGRELVVQDAGEEVREGQVIHLLPYFFEEDWQHRAYEVINRDELLTKDQRFDWWQRFGKLTGRGFDGLPKELQGRGLDEVTVQPLLNYLVALSFIRGNIDFSKEVNLNTIYDDLLSSVYERGWERSQHRQLDGISEDKFERVLEEIALATWHGNSRTATVEAVQSQCETSSLKSWLSAFEEGAKSGVTRLMTAFYFRQGGREASSGERTFEFTHKSFGEYLTARRILRSLEIIRRHLKQHEKDADFGWDELKALSNWLRICGPATIDHDLHRFILQECQLRSKQDCTEWQGVLVRLINHRLARGWPADRLNPRPSFREEKRQARNAGEALLAVHLGCSSVSREVAKINWPSETSAGTWIGELRGQRMDESNLVSLHSLNFLDFRNQTLLLVDLHLARLEGANLRSANLQGANLQGANLQGANLRATKLQGANLRGANLYRANLKGANLQGAILQDAHLGGANLRSANLQDANLQDATLQGARLQDTKLQDSSLQGAKLEGAKLQGANFYRANLEDANLYRANLKGANLFRTNLKGAKLFRADLTRTILDLDGHRPDESSENEDSEVPSA